MGNRAWHSFVGDVVMKNLKNNQVKLACGAIGTITKVFQGTLYPFVVEFSQKTCDEFPVFGLQTHDVDGFYDHSGLNEHLKIVEWGVVNV